jgi:hypothetical protein
MNIEDIVYSIDFAPWKYCAFNNDEVYGIIPQIQKQINGNINIYRFDEAYPHYIVSNNMSEGVYIIVDEIFDMIQFYCLQYED